MISCEQASMICNKSQYDEASWFEKIKLRLHMAFCKTCAKYSAKNTQFTALCQNAHLQSLSEKEKSRMKEELKEKL